MGFLTGKVMQASGGKANPKIIQELLANKLGPVP
jgi:Asp-tRNA(Asn)/Glu-tRNA(Gln) amidotransferase B subunit